ncbi:Enoyl-CoA hydratase/isomerase family [Musa troglodytarum]|uniref:3-hydroxyisobutyryl-CoA hydrolase n=1 Tax=Musa troglodytarum TaxID=320322 RepID=A0A9E7K579_9LILI|nr:Enoyl-CoA hydratase/isomerase family [Musa troglodytarum]
MSGLVLRDLHEVANWLTLCGRVCRKGAPRREYVGLTGARLDGAEMLACGLATHFVPSTNLAYPEDLLTKVETSDPFVICASIDRFSQMVPLKTSSAYNR